MWPFSQKPKKSEKEVKPSFVPPKVCSHKYQDFSWYVDGNYDYNTEFLTVKIYAPYVCIHCGHRKNVLLTETTRSMPTFKEAEEFYEKFQEPFKEKLKHRAFVEEEINDMILVDRQYIEIYKSLHPERFGEQYEKASSDLSLPG